MSETAKVKGAVKEEEENKLRFDMKGVMLPWALVGALCIGAIAGGGTAAGKYFGGDGLEEARKVSHELKEHKDEENKLFKDQKEEEVKAVQEVKDGLTKHLETAALNRENNLKALGTMSTQIATLEARGQDRDRHLEELSNRIQKLDDDLRASWIKGKDK